jgi:type III pantothenate kinase
MMEDLTQDPRTNASLLVFEIGNSHVAVATSIAGQILTNERFELSNLDGAVEHANQAWEAMPDDRIAGIAAGSVVPKTLAELRKRVQQKLGEEILAVGEELHRPMVMAVETPESVGIDRICSAAACYETLKHACVVASFGTAITIDCVNDEGVFLGGAILPGLHMQARALHEQTASLPLTTIEDTSVTYGATTEQAIRNGVIIGVVGALREITERYATDLHVWPQLVVTGGGAELVRRHCEFIDSYVPDLCIRGIAIAHRKHFDPLGGE